MNEEHQKRETEDMVNAAARPQKIYLKDASFESPNSPEIFAKGWAPNLEVEIDSHTQQIADDTFDVVMKVTAKATNEGSNVFLAEVQQAGIFLLKGFDPEKLRQVQNVFCLRTLFPYASAALADLITKGGFPSLMLPPMNFAAMYDKRLERQERPADDQSMTSPH